MIKQQQQATVTARPQARATVPSGNLALPVNRLAAVKPANGNGGSGGTSAAATSVAAPVLSRLTERRLRALAQDTRQLPKRYWRIRFPM